MGSDTSESGITSLAGFAFQMRLFILLLPDVPKTGQIEFETIEDVTINNINTSVLLDKNAELFYSMIGNNNIYKAYQVKRSDVSNGVIEKVIFNWLILESKKSDQIEKYILVTDGRDDDSIDLFSNKAEKIFEKICRSDKRSDALITKLKMHYNNDFDKFKKDYSSIQAKHTIESKKYIDEEIFEKFSTYFHKDGVNIATYSLRIKQLISTVSSEILNSIILKQPYICTYAELMNRIERISIDIKDEEIEIDFVTFKKATKIDIDDLGITGSREYKQLKACELSQTRIEEHLVYCQYYQNLRMNYLSNRQSSKVENLETTTFCNYEDSRDHLIRNGIDSPYNRLDETKKRDNYYASKNQVRYGSCIYLTRKTTDQSLIISWDDEL